MSPNPKIDPSLFISAMMRPPNLLRHSHDFHYSDCSVFHDIACV
jgi:hypothetical protein